MKVPNPFRFLLGRFRIWKARRILKWNDICPDHFQRYRGWDNKCPECALDANQKKNKKREELEVFLRKMKSANNLESK